MEDFLIGLVEFLLHLYDGLPVWSVPIFLVALCLILLSIVSLGTLMVQAVRQTRRERRETEDRGAWGLPGRRRHAISVGEDDFLWVFMVPALNEEITIADSVGRLSEVQVTNRVILVINDGSDDDTAAVLDGLEVPELTVLQRVPPEARQGKSEALNDAWRYLHRELLADGKPYGGWPTDRVIVTIVDADGRLDPASGQVARYFADGYVGGVQSLVRIYNRTTPLTWAQDVEFAVFAHLFQRGRMPWGTANMGGNGQFNRLAALDSVAEDDEHGRPGPWKAGRLTEDQDIGLRMIHRGWLGAQSTKVTINQQGLNSLRLLYRQRTRWSQGGWQVLDLIPATLRSRGLSPIARFDQLWYLMTPIVQAWVGLSVVLSVIFLVTGIAAMEWTILIAVLFYVFSAGPGIAGVLLSRPDRGLLRILLDFLLAHWYLVYSWLIYPVVYRALMRQLFRRRSWAKTKRETIS